MESHNSIAQISEEQVIVPTGLRPQILVPGDKSITHRAVIFGSIAEGKSTVKTNVLGRDNFATIRIFQQLGVRIELVLNSKMSALALSEGIENVRTISSELCTLEIYGQGLAGLKSSGVNLDCGNSGTTGRLLCGLFSALNFPVTIIGDESLSKRPFARVTEPLTLMGADFSSSKLPITISGGKLKGISYKSPKSTAQVKSALMIAGLFAEGKTSISEPYKSRDHTEKMLAAMGADIQSVESEDGETLTTITPNHICLQPIDIEVPGDISAAMFFIVAGLLNPHNSKTIIKRVGINPTRSACLEILRKMGASIVLDNIETKLGELVADICVERSELVGINISKIDVAMAVDEIPIIAVAASFANGITEIVGAEELRVKESDRISMTVALLKSYGVSVVENADGMRIHGPAQSKECDNNNFWKACGDHRISMCGAIMEYLLGGKMRILDMKSIETSFPSFLEAFKDQ